MDIDTEFKKEIRSNKNVKYFKKITYRSLLELKYIILAEKK
jgi:hypothetical protein